MSVPIFTHAMNGMLTGDYTRSDLRKIVTEQRPKPPAPTYVTNFDITPMRGDLADIGAYLDAHEAAARWKKDSYYEYKPKTTDELMRTFLVQMIESETARRAEIEAEADMPYAGVVARNIERKRKLREAFPEPPAEVRTVARRAPRAQRAPRVAFTGAEAQQIPPQAREADTPPRPGRTPFDAFATPGSAGRGRAAAGPSIPELFARARADQEKGESAARRAVAVALPSAVDSPAAAAAPLEVLPTSALSSALLVPAPAGRSRGKPAAAAAAAGALGTGRRTLRSASAPGGAP